MLEMLINLFSPLVYIHTKTVLTLGLWLICRQSVINECFSKESVKQIIQAFVSHPIFLEQKSFPPLFIGMKYTFSSYRKLKQAKTGMNG